MKKIFYSLLLFFALATSGYAQSIGQFKTIRLVNLTDSTSVTPINGSIYYNTQSNKFRGYQNGAWYNLIGGGGSSTLASGNLVQIAGDSASLGGVASADVVIDGNLKDYYSTNWNYFNVGSLNANFEINDSTFSIDGTESNFKNYKVRMPACSSARVWLEMYSTGVDNTACGLLKFVSEVGTGGSATWNGMFGDYTSMRFGRFSSAGTTLVSGFTTNSTNTNVTFTGQIIPTALASSAGFSFGSIAGDVSSGLTDGNAWYNSSTDRLKLRANGVSQTVAFLTDITGGITNTAANNEMAKSDGTNLVPSGLFSTTAGNLTLGNAASTSGSDRTIVAEGLGSDISLSLEAKGAGLIDLVGQNIRATATHPIWLTTNQYIALEGSSVLVYDDVNGSNFQFTADANNNFIYANQNPGSPGVFGIYNYGVQSETDDGNRTEIRTGEKDSLQIGDTGAIWVLTGGRGSSSGNTGEIYLESGPINGGSGIGNSGQIKLISGYNGGSGNVGNVILETGYTLSGASGKVGDVILRTGDQNGSGSNGNILLDVSAGGSADVQYGSSGSFNITGIVESVLLAGTSLTLDDDLHRGKIIYCTSGSPITVNVPSGLPLGFNVVIVQDDAGTVSLNASGTTLNGKTATTAQYDAISLAYYKSSETYIGF